MTRPVEDGSRESPSLTARAGGIGRAYELKFRIDLHRAARVEEWARGGWGLALDAYGNPALDGVYLTTNLYLDTPDLDVLHRRSGYGGRKFRVRRYGDAPALFLERKTKRGDRVRKRRTCVPDGDLALLAGPASDLGWPGNWFHRRVLARGLGPAGLVSYRRTAYVGTRTEGPLRLTLDRELRGLKMSEWNLDPSDAGSPLLLDSVILELKFFEALPRPFKELLFEFGLTPTPISKYRLCRDAAPVRDAEETPDGTEVPVA